VALTACTGRGGGQLPPDGVLFTGPASFGFSFSCEDSSTSLNSPPGQLRIQLSFNERGTNPLGSSFSMHGTVDEIDPVLESMICIGENPSPGPYPNELIFLGRYRLTSSPPARFPTSACPSRETDAPLCRFEVIVRDNDMNRAPSTGDYFQIKLSKAAALSSEFVDADVVYTRAGLLSSGNLTVD
jgi:hypothetical protein